MPIEEFVERLGLISQTPIELEPIARLAAFVADVPMAAINVVTDTAQYHVAAVGFEPQACSREASMCAVGIDQRQILLIDDARQDERFRDNPFVTGERARIGFFFSIPLQLPDGLVPATLCVFDEKPRRISPRQYDHLLMLADRIVDVLTLHMRQRELGDALEREASLVRELTRSNAHLSAYAGEVSHDLRNPLAAIGRVFDRIDTHLAGEQIDADRVRGWAADGLAARDAMDTTIKGFLDFARVGGAMARSTVDLDELVRQVRLALDLDGQTLRVHGRLPAVEGSVTQLRSVLENLISNALKYGRPTDASAVVIDVSGSQTDLSIRLEVADRGPGVPDGGQEALFEPLVQGEAALDGYGIGLATSRRIMQAHGGSIGLTPRPGGGTIAWIELPRLG